MGNIHMKLFEIWTSAVVVQEMFLKEKELIILKIVSRS